MDNINSTNIYNNIFEYHDINNLIFANLRLKELNKIYTLSKNINLQIKYFVKKLPFNLNIIHFLDNSGYEEYKKLNYTPRRIKKEIKKLINVNKFNYMSLIYISNYIKEPIKVLKDILDKLNDENLCFASKDKVLIDTNKVSGNLLIRILLFLDLKKDKNIKIYINKTTRTRPFYNNKKSLYFKDEELEKVDKILNLL